MITITISGPTGSGKGKALSAIKSAMIGTPCEIIKINDQPSHKRIKMIIQQSKDKE